MAPTGRKVHAVSSNGDIAFSSRLRFELVDEEQRALLASYGIASAVGVAFLLLIHFGPRPAIVIPPLPTVVVGDLNPFGPPTVIPAKTAKDGSPDGSRDRAPGRSVIAAIGGAFDALGATSIGQPNDILGKVAVTPRGSGDTKNGGKTVLAHGQGGLGSMPARGGISSGGGGAGIGGVARGGEVSRIASNVGALPSVTVAPLPPAGDAAAVGTFVRGYESQLRFCYEENGLAANPKLAGSITVSITVAGNGAVSAASIAKRSWSGPGSAEAESCILRTIRGWRLPASGGAPGTYSFPFNFSR